MLDYYLAPYVAKSFIRNCCKWLEIKYNMDSDWLKEHIAHALDPLCVERKGIMDDAGIQLLYPYYQKAIKHFSLNLNSDAKEQIVFFQMTKWSKDQTRKDTYQAMEAMIHNLNTLQCIPGSERIWVKERTISDIRLVTVQELYEIFVPDRYEAISVNPATKQIELKTITHVTKKDNHRRLITLHTPDHKKATTTDNHQWLICEDDQICFATPENIYRDQKQIVVATSVVDTQATTKTAYEMDISDSGEEYVYDLGVQDNENFLTEDCIFIHNSRAGAQTPFSSVNFGTDTSPEGRMVVMEFLNAQEAGLGNHETAIFPISIFKMKKGVNDKGSPNYDLFHRACEVSAKRLYPKNWAS